MHASQRRYQHLRQKVVTPLLPLTAFAVCTSTITRSCLATIIRSQSVRRQLCMPYDRPLTLYSLVAEFQDEVYRPADLDMFFNTYAPDQVGHIPELISIAGGTPYLHSCFALYSRTEYHLQVIQLVVAILGSLSWILSL